MRIGIDATALTGPRTGIEYYISNIVTNLLLLDNVNKYIIYCKSEIPVELLSVSTRKNIIFREINFINRKIFQQIYLPLLSYKDKVDVMFYPGNTMAILSHCPTVVTIHDIFPFVIPQFMPKYHKNNFVALLNNIYWKFINKQGCNKAKKIIAVSNSTKNDILKVFGILSDKIEVIHESIPKEFSQRVTLEGLHEFRVKYNLRSGYILCVGTGAYKNLQGSIAAFTYLKRHGYGNLKLVITGPKERLTTEVLSVMDNANVKEDLIFMGYFPQEDLPFLYAAAELFLFPSFYEGFGIPVLEAFASSIPVITSNTSSLIEVAEGAAELVEPTDYKNISEAIHRVLSNDGYKSQLVKKGIDRLKQFSWEKAASQTLRVIENSFEKKGGN